MPVVVTGADQPLGRAVVEALLAGGAAEVRATVRDPDAVRGLVARGVRTAVTDLDDPARLGGVLEGAHTVIHLDGSEPLHTWEALLEAAEASGLRRLVTVCGPAERPPPTAAYQVVAVQVAGPVPGARPAPELVAALVDADRRRDVGAYEIVAPGGPARDS